uniref:Zinc finger protein 706 n=2 Tax=Gouania willdenowi TaxID=441366 RepID=A0A8C5ES09_GOUWI
MVSLPPRVFLVKLDFQVGTGDRLSQLPEVGLQPHICVVNMARGHQKIQSQQKNAKKQADMKKAKGHDQKTAAKAALVFTCSVCKSQMPDPKTFKQHFESKHPKSPLPPELEGVEA